MNSPAQDTPIKDSPAQDTPTPAQAFVGIDVSKATLDACLITATATRHKAFPNTEAGYAQMLAWTQANAPGLARHFALEVTASYSRGLALFLTDKGQRTSLLNPARVRHAALSRGAGNKTDKADTK